MAASVYTPFSQRTGLTPRPPQLGLGEVSEELRRQLDYYFTLEIDRESFSQGGPRVFDRKTWERVATDLHVLHFKQSLATFSRSPQDLKNQLRRIILKNSIGDVFDLVEFVFRHSGCSKEFKADVVRAFEESRTPYRIVDRQIIAIGTEEQGAAFEKALEDAEAADAAPARKCLVAAGKALRDGEWPRSVQHSIDAVEVMARRLAPGKTGLASALAVLENKGHLHHNLRIAFDKLYGYTSDEQGVRHPTVFANESKVDETDALFMLGACASFVSYLLARTSAIASQEAKARTA